MLSTPHNRWKKALYLHVLIKSYVKVLCGTVWTQTRPILASSNILVSVYMAANKKKKKKAISQYVIIGFLKNLKYSNIDSGIGLKNHITELTIYIISQINRGNLLIWCVWWIWKRLMDIVASCGLYLNSSVLCSRLHLTWPGMSGLTCPIHVWSGQMPQKRTTPVEWSFRVLHTSGSHSSNGCIQSKKRLSCWCIN